MRKVLVPVDDSRHAFQAAVYLVDFVRQHGPVAVHVVNVEPRPLGWQTHGMESEAIQEHLAVRAHLAMKPVLHALAEAGIPYESHVRLGDAAETIVALAEELGCDAIVMGARSHGALSRLALGSVTSQVLQRARMPVVCVKAPPA